MAEAERFNLVDELLSVFLVSILLSEFTKIGSMIQVVENGLYVAKTSNEVEIFRLASFPEGV